MLAINQCFADNLVLSAEVWVCSIAFLYALCWFQHWTQPTKGRDNWHHRPKTFIEKIVLAVGFGISMPSMIFFFLGIFGIIFSYL